MDMFEINFETRSLAIVFQSPGIVCEQGLKD